MTQYQATPDYYRDYIEHGWLKDQAAKVHKYIERWRGKNGKWYYRYKSKAQELGAKANRTMRRVDPAQISLNNGKEPIHGYAYDNGKATSRTGTYGNFQNSKKKDVVPASGHTKGLKTNSGIAAGRKRTAAQRFSAVKGAKNKRTRGKTGSNLTSRGYSGSQGSGESKRIRNTASRRTVRYPWGSNIHRWIDNKGHVITNKVQYTVRGDGKEQNPDYWENRRKRAKKK